MRDACKLCCCTSNQHIHLQAILWRSAMLHHMFWAFSRAYWEPIFIRSRSTVSQLPGEEYEISTRRSHHSFQSTVLDVAWLHKWADRSSNALMRGSRSSRSLSFRRIRHVLNCFDMNGSSLQGLMWNQRRWQRRMVEQRPDCLQTCMLEKALEYATQYLWFSETATARVRLCCGIMHPCVMAGFGRLMTIGSRQRKAFGGSEPVLSSCWCLVCGHGTPADSV